MRHAAAIYTKNLIKAAWTAPPNLDDDVETHAVARDSPDGTTAAEWARLAGHLRDSAAASAGGGGVEGGGGGVGGDGGGGGGSVAGRRAGFSDDDRQTARPLLLSALLACADDDASAAAAGGGAAAALRRPLADALGAVAQADVAAGRPVDEELLPPLIAGLDLQADRESSCVCVCVFSREKRELKGDERDGETERESGSARQKAAYTRWEKR